MPIHFQFRFSSVSKLCLVFCTILLASCSATRFVPEDKLLLNKASVKTDTKNLKREELKLHIRQKENLRILGFIKFHLAVYNLSSAKKENDWLKRVGEAPVLFDDYQTKKTRDQLQILLKNKGYYNAVVHDSLTINKPRKKLNLLFDIKAGTPYRVRNYTYQVQDKSIEGVLVNDSVNQLLKKNDLFDLDILNAERKRIATFFKDRGYYKFIEDFVSFQADSNLNSHQVDIVVNSVCP